MPYKPKKPCKFSGCPILTDGRYCKKHQRLIDSQYNKYERAPQTYHRYNSCWKRIRKLYIKEHPLCELCKKEGRLTPVQEVHHIVPLSSGGSHSQDNLMSLCKSCHSRLTAKEGGRWSSL